MNQEVSTFKSRPILVGSLSLLVLLICCNHFLIRVGFDQSVLIGLTALIVFFSLAKEAKTFLLNVLEEPRKNFLILCILFFSCAGIIFHFENTIEIGLFVILFFSIYFTYLLIALSIFLIVLGISLKSKVNWYNCSNPVLSYVILWS